MAWRSIALVWALGASAALPAQTAMAPIGPVAAPPAIDKTTQAEEVAFSTEAADRMTVPVRLSGKGPYRFLVDTGADRTAISRELAGKLKLLTGEAAALHTVTGMSAVGTATVPSLLLTRKAVKIVDAPVLDKANIGADGILGVDSLGSQRVQFDFVAKTMTIVPSRSADFPDEPGAIIVLARRRNGRLIVTNATANRRSMTVVLDTGAQISIGNEALRQQLSRGGLIDPVEKVELESVTGEKIQGDYMFVREMQIGGIVLKNLAVVFADAHTFKQLKLARKPALLLGMNAIRAFKKVSIDFANRKFRVVLPEQSSNEARLAQARVRNALD